MENKLSIQVKKKDLAQGFRKLSPGFRFHRKMAHTYHIAFSAINSETLVLEVLGAYCQIPASITGNYAFALPYSGLKKIISSIKTKDILLELKADVLVINGQVNIQLIRQMPSVPQISLPMEYVAADLLRIDRSNLPEETIAFWGLAEQLDEAAEVIENDIKRVYKILVTHLPRCATYKSYREMVYKELLGLK